MRKLLFTINCFLLLSIANAQTLVMKADGIKGESDKAKFKDKTELLGFVLEGNSPQSSTAGGGMATGKRVYQPITILKQSGTSSPMLFQHFFMGRFIREITI